MPSPARQNCDVVRRRAPESARRRRRAQGSAIALTMALALVACGSADGSADGSTSRSGLTTPAGSAVPRASDAPSASPSSGSATQPSGAYDFCRLVSPAEAVAILGKPAKDAKRTSSTTALGPVGSCAYLSTDYTLTSPSIVNVVYLGNKISRSQYDEETAEIRASAKPVPGLGETASFIPGLITIFDHGVAMTVQVVNGGVPAGRAPLTALAHTTLERAGEIR
jgi:hypothetical protein